MGLKNLTIGETFSISEMDIRLAKLANRKTPKEKRQLLRKWSNEAFRRGMQYEKKRYS